MTIGDGLKNIKKVEAKFQLERSIENEKKILIAKYILS